LIPGLSANQSQTSCFCKQRSYPLSGGHYVFATMETFTSGKLKLSDGRVVGEIRSGNTVILTEPSPHPKADEGSEYRWITTGTVPPLPDEATVYLTTKAGGGSVGSLVCGAHRVAPALAATDLPRQIRRMVAVWEKCHDAMMDCVRSGP
jgi:hypothetical protein